MDGRQLALLIVAAIACGCAGGPTAADHPVLAPHSGASIAPASAGSDPLLVALGAAPEAGAKPALTGAIDDIGMHLDDTIFTASARTVDFNGQALIPRVTVFRATSLYDGNEHVGDPLDRELTVVATSLRGVVGLNEDVTLAVTVPYVSKALETRMGGRRVRLNASGLGDVAVTGKWRFFKDQDLGETTELAAFLGVELPSGRGGIHDGGIRLPQPLQPGSGSFDGTAGVALSRLWDGGRWLVNADTFFKFNTEANGYRFGHVLRFDVGAQYRIYPDEYESFDQTTVNLIIELNGHWAAKDTAGGDRIDTTGGVELFLSPGVQVIVNEDLLFEAGVQIPFFRDLNGPQLARDFLATAGLRWRF